MHDLCVEGSARPGGSGIDCTLSQMRTYPKRPKIIAMKARRNTKIKYLKVLHNPRYQGCATLLYSIY